MQFLRNDFSFSQSVRWNFKLSCDPSSHRLIFVGWKITLLRTLSGLQCLRQCSIVSKVSFVVFQTGFCLQMASKNCRCTWWKKRRTRTVKPRRPTVPSPACKRQPNNLSNQFYICVQSCFFDVTVCWKIIDDKFLQHLL